MSNKDDRKVIDLLAQKVIANEKDTPKCTCGSMLSKTYAFCPKCGKKNLRFDKEAFKRDVGSSFEDFVELQCNNDTHQMILECLEGLARDIAYCSECGKYLLPC